MLRLGDPPVLRPARMPRPACCAASAPSVRYCRSNHAARLHASRLPVAGTKNELAQVKAEIATAEQWARERRLHKDNPTPIILSDLVSQDPDDAGITLQWVNLVMAGGGMLGIAHIGFVHMLEQAGVRFLGLGGASAGAINALLIAGVRERPDKTSWEKTEEIFHKGPFEEFEDGHTFFKKLRQKIESQGLLLKLRLFQFWRNRGPVRDAYSRMGVHKGESFLHWLEDILKAEGVTTTEKLLDRMKLGKNGIKLYLRQADWQHQPLDSAEVEAWTTGDPKTARDYPLRLVTSEVATQNMIVFPRDADLFYEEDTLAPPADFVRASMSVPVFFQPFTIPYTDNRNPKKPETRGVVRDGTTSENWKCSEAWEDRHKFTGKVPTKAVFCDGGTLSNFPIHLFADDKPAGRTAPLCPTIGVRLDQDRANLPPIDSAVAFLGGMFDTSRNLLDRQFLFKNPMYDNWVGTVKTKDFDWLDFTMSALTKHKLMLAGMKDAQKFLETKIVPVGTTSVSDWETYKVIAQLQETAVKARRGEIGEVARTLVLQNLELEEKYNTVVQPAMHLLEAAKDELRDKWAFGVFVPSFDSERREELLEAWREIQSFWREVEAAFQPKSGQFQVITRDWWTRNWIDRGTQYRLLAEPLEIANYYFTNQHLKNGHYIDLRERGSDKALNAGPGPQEQLYVDIDKRPDTYVMVQKLAEEAVKPVSGWGAVVSADRWQRYRDFTRMSDYSSGREQQGASADSSHWQFPGGFSMPRIHWPTDAKVAAEPSSLETAVMLKAMVGSKPWQQFEQAL